MNVNDCNLLHKIQKLSTLLYCMMMYSFFLFYVQDGYFHITNAKRQCFILLTLLFIVSHIVILCLEMPINVSKIKQKIVSLSITDQAMLAMLASHIITTMLSPYQEASLYGSSGRGMGLYFSFMITIIYFIVSRHLSHQSMVIHCFLISTMLVTLLALINAFGIDPFHYFEQLQPEDEHRFLSTIGNVTFFAHLMCLTLPFSLFLLEKATDQKLRLVYGLFAFLGFCGIYISHIDGAYLGLFALMTFYFFHTVHTFNGLKQFMLILTLAFLAMKSLMLISWCGIPLYLDGLSAMLVYGPITNYLCILAIAILFLFHLRPLFWERLSYQRLRQISAWIIVSGLCLLLGMLIYFTWIQPKQPIGSWATYLRFDDAWGSMRGFLWRRLIPLFCHDTPLLYQLFGQGLDCTRLIMIDHFANTAYVAPFDHAHNECIQYLLTSGIMGLTCYLAVWLSAILRLLKRAHHDPYMLGIIAALLTHGAWSITGLNQPITTPLLYLLIAIGESYLRQRSTSISS